MLEKGRVAGRVAHGWILNCQLDLGTCRSGDVWESEDEQLEEGAKGRDGEAVSLRIPHRQRRHEDVEAGMGMTWWTSRCTATP